MSDIREISVELVKKTVEELCVKANLYLPDGMKEKINSCIGCEKSPLSKQVLGDIVRNIDCAKELEVPICQDTGMAIIFLEVGQDVHFTGGDITDAINEGVASPRNSTYNYRTRRQGTYHGSPQGLRQREYECA